MKRFLLIAMTTLILAPASALARDWHEGKRDWKEIWKAEKIAFLTSAMDLSSSEAEAFWPLYNQAEREKFETFKAVMAAYKALDDAIKAGKSDSEVSKLLDSYLETVQKEKRIDAKYAKEYRKVLSEKKVAKLFIGEEQFRRRQIHRLNNAKKDEPDKN